MTEAKNQLSAKKALLGIATAAALALAAIMIADLLIPFIGEGLDAALAPEEIADLAYEIELTEEVSALEQGIAGLEQEAAAAEQEVQQALQEAEQVARSSGSMRDYLMNNVENTKLKNCVDQLYRPGATVGDGGTAEMISDELARGDTTHVQKGLERITNLQNIIKSENLS